MKSFKEFGITSTTITAFRGEKIRIDKILNQEVTVHRFKLEPSQFKGQRLDVEITYKGETRMFWTSAKPMIEDIQKVPADAFPFLTTIIKENETYLFT